MDGRRNRSSVEKMMLDHLWGKRHAWKSLNWCISRSSSSSSLSSQSSQIISWTVVVAEPHSRASSPHLAALETIFLDFDVSATQPVLSAFSKCPTLRVIELSLYTRPFSYFEPPPEWPNLRTLRLHEVMPPSLSSPFFFHIAHHLEELIITVSTREHRSNIHSPQNSLTPVLFPALKKLELKRAAPQVLNEIIALSLSHLTMEYGFASSAVTDFIHRSQ